MMTIGAVARSFRPGEVRLEDIEGQGDEVDVLDVLVLDAAGNVQRISVQFTHRWGATSWRRALLCSACAAPVRVLRVVGGTGVCTRCSGARTAHHLHKNSSTWRQEGALADEVVRHALRQQPASSARVQRLARRLKRVTFANAANALDHADRVIQHVDRSR